MRSLVAALLLALTACDLQLVERTDRAARAVIEAFAAADSQSLDTLVAARTRASNSFRELRAHAFQALQHVREDSVVLLDAEFLSASGERPVAHLRYQVGRPSGRTGFEIWMEREGSRWLAETILLTDIR